MSGGRDDDTLDDYDDDTLDDDDDDFGDEKMLSVFFNESHK